MPESEISWRCRFRIPHASFPVWARHAPWRLLYTANTSGKWELYAWDRLRDAHRQVTDRSEGTWHGEIDPSGEWIWWFHDEKGNEFGQWMVEPFMGGRQRLAAVDVPAAYSAGLALGRHFAVIGVATDGSTAVYLMRPHIPATLLYTHHEMARVRALSSDERLIALSHSEHGDSQHPAVRILTMDGQCVRELWDGPGYGLWATEWSPVVGDARVIVQHQRRDARAPLLWDVRTNEVADIRIDLPGDVEASWYPDARGLLLRHNYHGRSALYRYDLVSRGLECLPTDPGAISAARVRPDGEVWYAWSHSATPAQIRNTTCSVALLPSVSVPSGVAYTDHIVQGIHVFLAEPTTSRPHPTIFQMHGGPMIHDTDTFSPRVQAWVDHGFAVVLLNYRGSSGYGRAWRDALTGNPGFTELADIAAVHDWVVQCGIAQPHRIILSGESWGGYLTLLGLGYQPERWALGLAGVPVADYVAAYEDEMEPLKALDRALFKGSPESIPEVYRERSPLTYVHRLRVPVLILAGENDPRCPIRQIDNYLHRLRVLGKPHEVYRYDAGHGSLVIDETLRQIECELAFAAKYLGTPLPH